MRMTTVSAVVLATLLSGCVTGYSKIDFNPQQFAADQSQCNEQANMATLGSTGFMAASIFKTNKNMCMVGKGYTTMCGSTPCDPQY